MKIISSKILVVSLSAAALLAPGKSALAADVPFIGAVTSSCVLTVGIPGVLATSTDNKLLSSKIAGGISGTVAAVATGPEYSVSIVNPTEFTSAPGAGGSNVSFASEYQVTGGTNSGVKDSSESTSLATGLHAVSVDLEATKTSGVYEAGAYSATVVVTCEE